VMVCFMGGGEIASGRYMPSWIQLVHRKLKRPPLSLLATMSPTVTPCEKQAHACESSCALHFCAVMSKSYNCAAPHLDASQQWQQLWILHQ
jgi:hypothetical protein